MIKRLRDMNQLGRAYVLEAHTYLMRPKLDYAKAARLLQLGVEHDSPEAMYNLVRAFSALSLRSSFFVLRPCSSFFVLWSSFFSSLFALRPKEWGVRTPLG